MVGSVGAGKSSLLSALLGEMEQIGEEKVKEKKGEVELVGSLAYVSQQVGSGAPKVFKTINVVFFIGFFVLLCKFIFLGSIFNRQITLHLTRNSKLLTFFCIVLAYSECCFVSLLTDL